MLALSQGFYSVQQRLETLLMPPLIGIQQLGIYSAGMMFADRLSMIPDGLSTAFYPAIVRSSQESEEATSRQITYQMVISLVVCAPLVLLVSYFATPLGSLLMPKHRAECAFAIQVTIWYIPAMAASYAMGCALQALGKYSESAKLNMIAATLSIGVTLYLLKNYGFDGACWSIVARHTMTALWLAPLFICTFPRVLTSLPLARIGAATLLMKLLLLSYSPASAPAGGSLSPKLLLLHFAGRALVATLAYIGALALLRVIDLAEFFRLLQRKLPTADRRKSVSHEDETAIITL
jgi:O-antigen/teichoic acid export membrane protein